MELIKRLMKRGIITSIIILIYGIITLNKYIYIGMFLGSVVSLLGFYIICQDVKASIVSTSPSKTAIVSYLKRYVLYGILLGVLTKYYGFPMLVSSVMGLFNIKINIYILTIINKMEKFKSKHIK